jgi:DNA-binding transcriptional MerR regulator
MRPPPWKVGELARQTGLSVRALRWYDEIELLSPSLRTDAGYRLYTAADISRLQQVISLRQIGMSLNEVAQALRRSDMSPLSILELHIHRLEQEIENRQDLCRRLQGVAGRLRAAEDVSVADLTNLIEVINMFEKHYTPEQLQQLTERGRQLGDEAVHSVESEWPTLIAAVRTEMERGADPSSDEVQRLAQRWRALVLQFTGGDPGISRSLSTAYQQEPGAAQKMGLDPAIMAFIQRAQAAGKAAGEDTPKA